MARLREGRANTARGAAHFLRETVSRVRYGGARGQLTVRADSGFYAHSVVSVCRKGCPLLHHPPPAIWVPDTWTPKAFPCFLSI